jgi:hypothetical protein
MLPCVLAAVDVPVGVSVYIFVVIILIVNIDVAAAPIAVTPVATPSAPSGSTQRNSCTPR